MYDYTIIGQGIAGTTLGFELIRRNHKVLIIDNNPVSSSSKIASGLWNPIVLKRMKKVWNADNMVLHLHSFYQDLESFIETKIIEEQRILRTFHNIEERNNWSILTDKPKFRRYLSPNTQTNSDPYIKAEFGFGEVLQSGRINVLNMLNGFRNKLKQQQKILSFHIKKEDIIKHKDCWSVGKIQTKNIIFCQGYHDQKNPWFSYLPFALTKGEVAYTTSHELKVSQPIHGGKFILPMGKNMFKIGATYNWDQFNETPTTQGLEQLKKGWTKLTSIPFHLKEHQAGVRPTVKDRRPLLGTHPHENNLHIFNGLGSRGILMAPYLSHCMADYLEGKQRLNPEMNISRFNHLASSL